ncbi:hypothetical protein [Mesorhizobium sp. M1E.F.Ca.ET.041.01.1.1]|uniref:hypothetical protein n=1 Tax=Mesorhizobium sp. M1E.F.Ca.ET.041.01.1.1 TaxID=2496759 RepID=UPI001FDF5D12|nr:hypothetical protein [Mesorhizobium sp. M1E.F.Ca.ET.041.01.1.1]
MTFERETSLFLQPASFRMAEVLSEEGDALKKAIVGTSDSLRILVELDNSIYARVELVVSSARRAYKFLGTYFASYHLWLCRWVVPGGCCGGQGKRLLLYGLRDQYIHDERESKLYVNFKISIVTSLSGRIERAFDRESPTSQGAERNGSTRNWPPLQ